MRPVYKSVLTALAILAFTVTATADVQVDWSLWLSGAGANDDEPVGIGTDASENCYIAGKSYQDATSWDFVAAKYVAGGIVWERRFHGPGDSVDYPYTMAVSDAGTMIISGYTKPKGQVFQDFLTVAFGPDGDTLWVDQVDIGASDFARDIMILDNDTCLIVGKGGFPNSMAVLKYAPDGDTVWTRLYQWTGSTFDEGLHVDCDSDGNILVAGNAQVSGQTDLLTVKFSPDGDSLWGRTYDGPGNGSDGARGIGTDAQGNVYVTGTSEGSGTNADFVVLKYDPDGNLLWERRYDSGLSLTDEPWALQMDPSGNVIVTGGSTGSGTNRDVLLIKYAPDGDTLWIAREAGPGTAYEQADDMALDASGNIYITGYRNESGSGNLNDFLTMRIDPATGTKEWEKTWDEAYGSDRGLSICAGAEDHVWVTGIGAAGGSTGNDIRTVKYEPLETAIFEPQSAKRPRTFRLHQNYPNPFNAATVINFDLEFGGRAQLEIFNVLGQRVGVHAEENLSPGTYSYAWDGTDLQGRSLPSGIYLYRLTSDQRTETRKMTLLR
jgi:uncharacterized delta-60 repeat protein